MTFTLEPIFPRDFEQLSRIGTATGDYDSHTLLKRYGDVDYLRTDPASLLKQKEGFIKGLQNPKRNNVKAVGEDGKILGSIGVAYIGFTEDELAQFKIPKVVTDDDLKSKVDIDETATKSQENAEVDESKKKAIDAINDLEAWEQLDWRHWEKTFMPPGSKSVVITGVSVDPENQGQGVGTALVSWAAKKAEEAGVYIWVHSSEAGWRTFKKCGFQEIGRLNVDMDEWAKRGGIEKPEGKEGWGVYVCRWMKREHPK